MAKSPDAFRTISEVAEWLDIPAHVLRFWESRFTQVRPVKRAGGRRYYRPEDIRLLGGIKTLLHEEGLTIKGVQKILRERGVRHVADLAPDLDALPQAPPLPAPQLPVPADEVEEAGLLEDVEEEDVPATILAFPERGTAAEAGSDGPSQDPGAEQAAMAGGGEQGAPGADDADAASTEPREDDEKNAVPPDPSPGDGQARLDGRGHALGAGSDAGRREPAEVEPDRGAGEPGGLRDMNAERDSTAAGAPDPAQPSAFGESPDAAPDRPHPDDIYSREPALPAPLLGPLLLADPEALAARAADLAPILERLDGLLARRD